MAAVPIGVWIGLAATAASTGTSAYMSKRAQEKSARAANRMKDDEEKRRKELDRSQSEEARKEASLKQQSLLRQRRGRSSTLLTGGQGLGGWGDDKSPKATLLGE